MEQLEKKPQLEIILIAIIILLLLLICKVLTMPSIISLYKIGFGIDVTPGPPSATKFQVGNVCND